MRFYLAKLFAVALLFLYVQPGVAAIPEKSKLSVQTAGTSVTATWTPVQEALGYYLYYAPYPEGAPVDYYDLGTSLTASAGLPVGSAYYLAIAAYNTEGEGEISNIVNFTITGSDSSIDPNSPSAFTYADRGPGLSYDWEVQEARKTDSGFWVSYYNSDIQHSRIARFDWASRSWRFWDYEFPIEDFDVPRVNDQGDYAVLSSFADSGNLLPLVGTTETLDAPFSAAGYHVAMHWGDGFTSSDLWLIEKNSFPVIYNESSVICCPKMWDVVGQFTAAVTIADVYAAHRNSGYVLITGSTENSPPGLSILYQSGGDSVSLEDLGITPSFPRVAFNGGTTGAYAFYGGGIYRIDDLPNDRSAEAKLIADVSSYFPGNSNSDLGFDVEGSTILGPFGLELNTSGALIGSWLGNVPLNDPITVNFARAASESEYIFKNPLSARSIFAHVDAIDPETGERFSTWIEITSQAAIPYHYPF